MPSCHLSRFILCRGADQSEPDYKLIITCQKISTVMSGFIAFSYNLDMKIKGPSSRCRSDPYTQVEFVLCYGIGNILTILFSLHQLYKMQRISSFPKESDRLRCFVLVTTPLFTRLRFLQTIRTFAKFKSLLCSPLMLNEVGKKCKTRIF